MRGGNKRERSFGVHLLWGLKHCHFRNIYHWRKEKYARCLVFFVEIHDSPFLSEQGIGFATNGLCTHHEWDVVRAKIIPRQPRPFAVCLASMKIITLTLISLIAATSAVVQAQAIKEADLPAEEQGKFKAAKDAAYKSGDADLKQKNLDYKQTFREEMVKADPSIFPLLDKVFPVSGKTQMKVDELPAADAERYKAAQKAARKANPAIKEKQQAAQQALRAVMLKIDPSIGPIVDKVYPPTTASESDAGSSE